MLCYLIACFRGFVCWWLVGIPRVVAVSVGAWDLLRLTQIAEDIFQRVDDLFAAHAGFGEAEFQIEQLRRRAVGKREMLGPPGPGLGPLGDGFAHLLTGRTPLAGDFLDE